MKYRERSLADIAEHFRKIAAHLRERSKRELERGQERKMLEREAYAWDEAARTLEQTEIEPVVYTGGGSGISGAEQKP